MDFNLHGGLSRLSDVYLTLDLPTDTSYTSPSFTDQDPLVDQFPDQEDGTCLRHLQGLLNVLANDPILVD